MDVHEEEEEDEKYEFTEQRRRRREREREAKTRLARLRSVGEERKGGGGARLSRNGGEGGRSEEDASVRGKCAPDAAHLSLPNAHRPLPARSTNWANRWTPTDLARRRPRRAPGAHPFFRFPRHPTLLVPSADRID